MRTQRAGSTVADQLCVAANDELVSKAFCLIVAATAHCISYNRREHTHSVAHCCYLNILYTPVKILHTYSIKQLLGLDKIAIQALLS